MTLEQAPQLLEDQDDKWFNRWYMKDLVSIHALASVNKWGNCLNTICCDKAAANNKYAPIVGWGRRPLGVRCRRVFGE